MDGTAGVILLIIVLAALAGAFLLLREFNCWYFKINERIELQKRLISEINSLNTRLATQAPSIRSTNEVSDSKINISA